MILRVPDGSYIVIAHSRPVPHWRAATPVTVGSSLPTHGRRAPWFLADSCTVTQPVTQPVTQHRDVRLVAFDLDDTLAPSKSPIESSMAALLVDLLEAVEVCVISGGQFGQFRTQLIDNLPVDRPEALTRLHLMPTCGTQYYRFSGSGWEQVYAENLTDEQKSEALGAVEEQARRLGYWEERTWGPIL